MNSFPFFFFFWKIPIGLMNHITKLFLCIMMIRVINSIGTPLGFVYICGEKMENLVTEGVINTEASRGNKKMTEGAQWVHSAIQKC